MALNPDKYKIPQCEIEIDNTTLKSGKDNIESVSVKLSDSEKANACDIVLTADYDNKNKRVSGGLAEKIIAGRKVKVKMGYDRTELVFMGYINSSSISLSDGGVTAAVSCLDARGLLMGDTKHEVFDNKKVKQIAEELLRNTSGYVGKITVKVSEGKNISAGKDGEDPLVKFDKDNYKYICDLAKKSEARFCMIRDELMFTTDDALPCRKKATLKWGENIISFERTVDLGDQLGNVIVWGIEPESGKPFSAKAKPSSGGGKNGGQLNGKVKEKTLEIFDSLVKNQKEAQNYAESIMLSANKKLCTGSATVLGNASLVPGDKVEFDGIDPTLDGEYMITDVSHTFDSNGFISTIGFGRTTA